MFRDFLLALRQVRRRPGLSAAIVLTIGFGIAVATTSFSLVNGAFLRPLDVPAADRLVNVYSMRAGAGTGTLSHPEFRDLAGASGQLDGVLGYSGLLATWNRDGRAESLFGEIVTGSYFDVLGVRPALGRLFGPEDDRVPGQHPVVVVGYDFWRRRLAGDPGAVGRTMTLNGHPFTIVGVAPATFTGLLFRGFTVDVWAPIMMSPQIRGADLENRGERWMFVKGRLADGATVASAGAALGALAARLEADHPGTQTGRTFRLVPTSDVWLTPDADGPVRIMSALFVGACVLMLVVGATNVMSLLAARALSRTRDLGVQMALGATRGVIVRERLAEHLLLCGAGGAVGLGVAAWLASLVSSYRPPLAVPLAFDVSIDASVALFSLALTVAVVLLVTWSDLRRLRRADLETGLRSTSVATVARSRRYWLLVPQVAGSVVLLVVAGLLVRSVTSVTRVEPGFDIDPVGMVTFQPGASGLSEIEAEAFFTRLIDRVAARPDVRALAAANRIPLDIYGSQSTTLRIEGADDRSVQVARVTGGYFDALGIPVRAGRTFTGADRLSSQVAIVNEAFAAAHLDGAVIGRTIGVGPTTAEIVGVVGTVKSASLGEAPTPLVYLPLSEHYGGLTRLIVRADGAPDLVLDAVVREAALLRPDVAVFEQRTMSENVALLVLPFEIGSLVSTVLALAATLLGAVGLHGIASFAAASRSREFAIRMALGSGAGRLVRTATGEVSRALAIGLTLGIAVASLAALGLSGLVFGVAPLDPVTFITVPLVVVVVTAAAAAGPVRRVLSTNPASALRGD